MDWISRAIENLGYLGILLLTLAENFFPPLPSEVIIPLAGFTVSRGDLTLWGVIAAGTLGSLAGTLPYYLAGRWAGEDRLETWVDRHGRWLAVDRGDLDRSRAWFDKHGNRAVLIGRLVPGVRTLISVPAGLACMPLPRFLGYSAAGTILWTAALAGLGTWLGEDYKKVQNYLGPVSWVVLGSVVLAGAWWVIRKRGKSSSG